MATVTKTSLENKHLRNGDFFVIIAKISMTSPIAINGPTLLVGETRVNN